jgi:hypothetical protein
MSKAVSVGIYVGGQRDEHRIGDVQVTEELFKDAIAEWESPSIIGERKAWARHRGQGKVLWAGNRCYPPKKIMRIASREGVRRLKERQRDPFIRQDLEKGLNLMEGGYQVLDTYLGSTVFGFRVEGGLTPRDKQKCGC